MVVLVVYNLVDSKGCCRFSFATLSDSQRDTKAEIDQHERRGDEIGVLVTLDAVALMVGVVGRHVRVVDFSRHEGQTRRADALNELSDTWCDRRQQERRTEAVIAPILEP